ncbi:PERF protein, partial [Amia calva]|nr:PERF protein [Amia calva]
MERKGAYVINTSTWRKKDKTCTLCANPYMENQVQKLPLAVVDWRSLPRCKMQVSSTMYESSEAFVNSSANSVENNWKTGLDINLPKVQASMMVGGTHSRAAKYAMEKSKEDKYSFVSHEVQCQFYSFRLVDFPPLNREFSRSVKSLSNVYDNSTKASYRQLIETYGTHFIKKVQLGGKVKSVTSIKTCQAALNGFSETEVKDCLDVEASLTAGQRASVKMEVHHCQNAQKQKGTKQSFHSMFSERVSEVTGGEGGESDLLFSQDTDPEAFKKWSASLKTIPDIVSSALEPLHNLIHFKGPKKQLLKKALEDYIMEMALYKRCSGKCKAGSNPSVKDTCECVCQANNEVNSRCCPTGPGLAKLTVVVEKATGLWGDTFGHTDGYVKIFFNTRFQQTSVIYNNNNPEWKANLYFDTVKLSMDSLLTFEVWDEDKMWYKWWNDLLGKCSIKLQRGSHKDMCTLNHGTLYFSYTAECAPGLGGTTCSDYVPSPMSPSLKQTYVSRNAVSAAWLATNQS